MKNEGGAALDIIGGGAIPGGGISEEAPPTFFPVGFKTSTYFERTPLLPIACEHTHITSAQQHYWQAKQACIVDNISSDDIQCIIFLPWVKAKLAS